MEKDQKMMQYFPGAITYKGFSSFWESNLEGIEQIYILKGGPGTGKSTFMQRIAKAMLEKNYKIELLWCSSDARSLDAAIFREHSLAIVDGTAPHTRDPKYPGVRDVIIDLGKYWHRDRLLAHREQIIALTNRNKALFQDTYDQLKKARDFEMRNQGLHNVRVDEDMIKQWMNTLVKNVIPCNQLPKEPDHHRWIRVDTPQGMVSYLDELQALAKNCHCILTKERQHGSKILENLAKLATGKGCAIWYYHDPYEIEWLDAIYLPQSGCLFFQEAKLSSDHSYHVHEVDGWYHKQINRRNQLESEFLLDAAMSARCKGQSIMKENKKVHDELEVFYVRAMDFESMNQEKDVLIQEFLNGGGLK